MKVLLSSIGVALVATAFSSAALAQWTSDPSTNMPLGFGAGEQTVPHSATVPGGGDAAGYTYIGWYDNASGNYDLGLQLLSPEGEIMFADGGILVSDETQDSWVMDWSLAADAEGNAYLSLADIRDGNSNIHVYKISATGDFLWGNEGVTLTDDSDFKGPPCVTATSDGQVVVAWMQSGAETVIRMQRLAADGTLLLAEGGVVVSEAEDTMPSGNLLVPTADGDVILGYTPIYSFASNRQIKAQRFDESAVAVWAESVWVMDDATLPMGHYFSLLPDGQDGALFCWDVAVGNSFDARLQRITPTGEEALAHNGVTPEAGGPAGQISPSAVWDASTDIYTMVYIDMNSSQSARGLYAQCFDSMGNRLWNESGKVLLPQDEDIEVQPALALVNGTVMGVVEQDPGGAFGSDIVRGYGLDENGDFLWEGVVELATTSSDKGDLQAVYNGRTLVAVWVDGRSGTPDVYAQNLNDDGSLGPYDVSVEPDGHAIVPESFVTHQSYPNPFNPTTTIAFELPVAMEVRLSIFDLNGKLVHELVNGPLAAEHHAVEWDGRNQHGQPQPSGVYFYRLLAGDQEFAGEMTLLK